MHEFHGRARARTSRRPPAARSTRSTPRAFPSRAYLVTVAATDYYASVTTAEVKVEIEGQLKLGSFTLAFTDLELPAPGCRSPSPGATTRSAPDEQGDFGYGWRMDLLSVRVDVVQPGRDTDNPSPCARRPAGVHAPRRLQAGLHLLAPPGQTPTSTTTTTSTGRRSSRPRLQQHAADDGPPRRSPEMTNGFDDVDMMALYNPASGAYGDYDLTLRSGTKLAIDPPDRYCAEITDRTGNTLAFTPGGILHSAEASTNLRSRRRRTDHLHRAPRRHPRQPGRQPADRLYL